MKSVCRGYRAMALTVAAVLGCAPAPSETLKPGGTDESGPALGVTENDGRLTFRVYSGHATRMSLELFRVATGEDAALSRVMEHDVDANVFAATVSRDELTAAGIGDAIFYGLRAWGPNWPFVDDFTLGTEKGFVSDVDDDGNRFNPNKLLVDPYAREHSHDPLGVGHTDAAPYATGRANRAADNQRLAPKGIALPHIAADVGVKPIGPLHRDVIYEVHLRGLTMQDPDVPMSLRGTYAGAALKAKALKALGVTAIELLPLHETLNDVNDALEGSGGDNYWGYMSLSFFAPDRRYAADQSPGGPTRELQAMVKAFHDEGLKVLVDVVYNHTAEGAASGDIATLWSFRGLDNQNYYALTANRRGSYDNTGTGGNFNTKHPAAQRVIADSVRYWVQLLGVDGFRFDLASVLGNTCQHACFAFDATDQSTALWAVLRAAPPRPWEGGSGTDLIAEPWAIGHYQVGQFPPGWAEWNGKYRDDVRTLQNMLGSESVRLDAVASRLSGSADLYADEGRPPGASVNFMVAHDGFTLNDLYACNQKNNAQPWPYGPSSGGEDYNRSWDQGGDRALQLQAARTGFLTLAVSNGALMMTGGDEVLRTLRCNNNPFNVDSSANWLSYQWSDEQRRFRTFAERALAFRAAHPALSPGVYLKTVDSNDNGVPALTWLTPQGPAASAQYLSDPNNHALAFRLDGTELGDSAAALYFALNGWREPVTFSLPAAPAGASWRLVADTCAADTEAFALAGAEQLVGPTATPVTVCGHGAMLLLAR